jgi:glutaredoxin-related protein
VVILRTKGGCPLVITPGISPFYLSVLKNVKKKQFLVYINGILQNKNLKSKEPAKNQWPVLYQFFHENR